jgi:hydroxymethylpyrimidine/phosphomethylpyrimidine kinase
LARSPDLIWTAGGPRWLEAPRIDAVHTHGSGCVLSAAITAELARGRDPIEACGRAKRFVTGAIEAGFSLGAGAGPVDPGWPEEP